jgi:hypothetical protein
MWHPFFWIPMAWHSGVVKLTFLRCVAPALLSCAKASCIASLSLLPLSLSLLSGVFSGLNSWAVSCTCVAFFGGLWLHSCNVTIHTQNQVRSYLQKPQWSCPPLRCLSTEVLSMRVRLGHGLKFGCFWAWHYVYSCVMDMVYLGQLQVVACWPSPNWGLQV